MKKIVLAALLAALLTLCLFAGCGTSGDTVSVQSISLITGVGSTAGLNRFAGVVTASKTISIEKLSDLAIDEILVKQGDVVAVDDVLFTYDIEAVQLAVDKLELEIRQLDTNITELEKQLTNAKNRLDAANDNNRLEREIAYQEVSVAFKQAEYDRTQKNGSLAEKEQMLVNADVRSTINGTVQSVNESGSDEQGNPLPFMTVMEAGAYRVKGTINELNSALFGIGAQVLVRARVGDTSWTGVIESIDWTSPVQDNKDMYYEGSSDNGSASKYPFYVMLDSSDGLMLGQHVYIEQYSGESTGEGLWLPSYYVVDADSEPYVWAADSNDRLEKRSVTLGESDGDNVQVLSGLSLEDSIAFPAEDCIAGAAVDYFTEASFDNSNGGEDDFSGKEDFGGEDIIVDDGFATQPTIGIIYG